MFWKKHANMYKIEDFKIAAKWCRNDIFYKNTLNNPKIRGFEKTFEKGIKWWIIKNAANWCQDHMIHRNLLNNP